MGGLTLREGVHVLPAGDGSFLVTPDGDTFSRLQAAPDHVRAALDALEGGAALDDEHPAVPLLRLLHDAGLAVPATAARPWQAAPPPRVEVRGEGPVAEACAALLAEEGCETVSAGLDAPPSAADPPAALVACCGWLADRALQRLDAWAAEAAVPWTWCHREGERHHLGPFVLPGRTATYGDTRIRRLAAADHPDELERHWAFLDEGGAPPPGAPGAGVAAAVAGV